MVDYKFKFITEKDDKTLVSVVIYEGNITTADEYDFKSDSLIPITKYRRLNLLEAREFNFSLDKSIIDIKNEIARFTKTKGTLIEEQNDA